LGIGAGTNNEEGGESLKLEGSELESQKAANHLDIEARGVRLTGL